MAIQGAEMWSGSKHRAGYIQWEMSALNLKAFFCDTARCNVPTSDASAADAFSEATRHPTGVVRGRSTWLRR